MVLHLDLYECTKCSWIKREEELIIVELFLVLQWKTGKRWSNVIDIFDVLNRVVYWLPFRVGGWIRFLAKRFIINTFIENIARICAIFSHVKRAIRPISFAYSILHMWKCNQSPFRIESLSQSEVSTQMASEKRGLDISASLKFMFREMASTSLFGKWNISNILSARTSGHSRNRGSKLNIIQGGTFKFKQCTESEFVFAHREASPRHDWIWQ